jgi:hypothetical protein
VNAHRFFTEPAVLRAMYEAEQIIPKAACLDVTLLALFDSPTSEA